MNHTRISKEVLPDWARRGMLSTKGDCVHYGVHSEIKKINLLTIIILDLIKWKLNIFWIRRTFFNLYVARFLEVYIQNSLLAEGEFIQKSYVKTVLESRYTVFKYCTSFMVSKQALEVVSKRIYFNYSCFSESCECGKYLGYRNNNGFLKNGSVSWIS